MKKNFYYIVAFIFIFTGIFYLVNEYITILNTTDSVSAYYTHTISDLAVPYTVSTFSSLYVLFKTTFFVVGPIFFLCYIYLFKNRIEEKIKPACYVLAFLICVGVVMVGAFHTHGKYDILHILGTIITFSSANSLILLTGLYYTKKEDKIYRYFCLTLAFVGIFCGIAILLPIPQTIMPIFERCTIYPLIAFEIVSGFKLIFQYYRENVKYWIEIK